MDKLFLQIINMSITSSYVILFVIVIRLLLKKFPKIFSYALWFIVLFRLIFPFSIKGFFSLIPVNTSVPMDIAYASKPEINSGIAAIDNSVNNILPHAIPAASVNPMQIWLAIGEVIWLTGIFVLLVYSILTTLRLYKVLREATYITDNIYEMDKFKTPFVFGIIKPKIYLRANLSETERKYITLHEQTHIKRYDHVIKLISFLVTCVHWFNPLVWIAFLLMSEDMELSCDESVIKKMGSNIKRDYSSSLLSLSTGGKIIGGCPIAFGENNTKGRIKNVLNYKKPKIWVIAVAVVIIIILASGLLTNPLDDGKMYKIDETKVVRITGQSFLNGVRDFEVDQNIWTVLIDEINDAKWSDLSEEKFPDIDTIDSNITITLARDESVNNKKYTLYIYRNKHIKFLGGQEYEYSLALTYDDLTDNIKIWSLPEELYYNIRNVLTLSNEIIDDKNEITDKRFHIMTADDGAPVGCEYGTTRVTGKIDTLEMLSMLEKLQGFVFDEDYVSHQYIEFNFLDEKPKEIYLRYITKDEWQTEYPIDSATYRIKVPSKVGVYSFFADITWDNDERETVFFDITIKSKSFDKISAYLKEECINVFSPYYELLDFIISDYKEEVANGNVEAVFHYKMINKNYDRDPDTVEYIKEAKERGDKNYQIYYDEYLKPQENNFYFKAVIDENGEITLYTKNLAIESDEWKETKMSNYIIKQPE